MKVKYYVQPYGSMLAIGISGKNISDIEQAVNLLYNYKGIEGEAVFLSDTFAYVLTSEEQFFNGLYCKALSSLQKRKCNKRIVHKGHRISVLPWLADTKARLQFSKLTKEKFIFDIKEVDTNEYSYNNDESR